MSNFITFKHVVAAQFASMRQYPLFRVAIDKHALWDAYLAAFPPGTNPIYRERAEHDCSCCKQFIRTVGDIVALRPDGTVLTLWDGPVDDPTYKTVSHRLSALLRASEIEGPFAHYENHAGTDKTFEEHLDKTITTWNHFHINIPQEYVKPKSAIPTWLSEQRATFDVTLRGLREISMDAINTVLELIEQGSLYRGEEHAANVRAFKQVKARFDKLPADVQTDFVWLNNTPSLRIRNTVIGTLLTDLSEGVDLERAVKAFETKVAPSNYKRPTALITASMIASAKETIASLGLTSALERRYARLEDISVNDILFVDRAARKKLKGDVFDELAPTKGANIKTFDKVESISIDEFIANVLPNISTMEVMFEGKHQGNLVSLVAPVDPTAGRLFKWNNGFSWSYNGNVADSEMRRAVQARGGSVSGVFRFTHQWNYERRNASLMDLHVFMPGSDIEPTNSIDDFYGNRERVGWNYRNHTKSGGVQDVDYTDRAPAGFVPVENITFPSLARMPEGTYICKIHNWNHRPPTEGGFRAEIEFGGTVYAYERVQPLKHKEWVTVAEVRLKDGAFTIKHHLTPGSSSKEIWGLQTNRFQRVQLMALSPNHWAGSGVGNKHYFFMLDGAKNDGEARGFFNEFLDSALDKHRKVFEVVGSKMKATDSADGQLSGLGFSSTKADELIVKVTGSFTRTLKLVF